MTTGERGAHQPAVLPPFGLPGRRIRGRLFRVVEDGAIGVRSAWSDLGRSGRFALVGLIVAGAAVMVVASYLASEVREHLVAAHAHGVDTATDAMAPLLPDLVDATPLTTAELDRIDALVAQFLPDVARIKIWTLDGTVIHSDERSLIGQDDPSAVERLEHAAEIGLLSREADGNWHTANLVAEGGRIIEHSLPVADPASGEPEAILTVFEDMAYLGATLEQVQMDSRLLTFTGAILLIGAAFLVLSARQRVAAERLTAAAEEGERRRLVRDLHDSLAGQVVRTLYAVRRAQLVRPQRVHEVRGLLDGIEVMVEHTEEELRGFMRRTRESDDDAADLAARLRSSVRRFRAESGVRASLRVRGDASQLDAETRRILATAADEMLLNIQKHAGAKRVELSLDVRAAGVRLRVLDDGCGWAEALPPADGGRGLGLNFLRQRAAAAGGALTLASGPSKGACLDVRLPLRGSES